MVSILKTKFNNWHEIITTCNLKNISNLDFIGKWLISTRACVFSMTITSVLIGVMIAAAEGYFKIIDSMLCIFALTLAHASNNLINDYFDYKYGLDTSDYPRVKYSLHPLFSNLISKKELLLAFFIFSIIELTVAFYLAVSAGWIVIVFAAAGFFVSFFYVAPPFKLKYVGLGEFAIFIIWGPLIICGTYFVMVKNIPLNVWIQSIPYGLIVTNVLIGKHMDKYYDDKNKGVKTLPVMFGIKSTIILVKALTVIYYLLILLMVIYGLWHPIILISFISLIRIKKFFEILSAPKPKERPDNYPIWPLWYVGWAFWFNKLAGALFVSGLTLNIFLQ